MPGKYSNLKGQLTKFAGEPEYQTRVNERKEQVMNLIREAGDEVTIANIGYALLVSRSEKLRLETLEKDENLTIEACSQMLVEMLEGEDMNNVRLTNGASMSIKDDVYCTVANKEQFYKWIESTGQQDLLTVNYQTMSSLVKKRMLGEIEISSGEDVIPPGIETYFKQSIMVRGGNNNG